MRLNKLSNYGLKIYLQSQPSPKQVIAFDMGSVHTGCAISCLNLKKTYYLKSIKIKSKLSSDHYNEFYSKIEVQVCKIIKQNKPTALVFGIPQRVIEREYYQHAQVAMRTVIEGFVQKYQVKKNQEKENVLNFTLVDQAWTTQDATHKLKQVEQMYSRWGHLHKQKQLIDGMAAMKILEKFLTYYNTN